MKKYRTIIIIVAIVVVAVIAFFFLRARRQADAASQYQTVTLERGTLTATVGATGTVRASQVAILTWQTSGTVGSVDVGVGDQVVAGDVLATISKDSLPQSIILAEADLVAAQRNLDTILNSKTPQAQAQLAVINAQRVYDRAKDKLASLEQQGRAGQETIDNAWAQYVIARQAADTTQQNYDRLSERSEDDPLRAQAYTALYAAIQQRDRAYDNWNYYFAQPSERDIAEAEANLALAEAQLEDAQREWERLKDGPDANDIAAAQSRVTAIQATIGAAQIDAPFAGTVTQINPMPGDQVGPGTVAFRIDDLSRLLVDVQISEIDINNVKLNQPVTLSFDAILNQEYHGKVVEVAQVGAIVGGVVSFTVTVELEDADAQVKPGMTAAVTIVINELEDVLLIPNRAVRLVEGQRVVYVLRSGQVERVEITLGVSSDIMSEVIEGELKAGDTIILNPPAEFNTDGPPGFVGR